MRTTVSPRVCSPKISVDSTIREYVGSRSSRRNHSMPALLNLASMISSMHITTSDFCFFQLAFALVNGIPRDAMIARRILLHHLG